MPTVMPFKIYKISYYYIIVLRNTLVKKTLMLTRLTYTSSNVLSWKAEATRLTYRSHLGLLVCSLCVCACGI